MTRVVIIGAGGHGREVLGVYLDCIAYGEDLEVVGFLDENLSRQGEVLDGFPVLGDWRWFNEADREEVLVVCAVGTPAIARRLILQARQLGLRLCNAISPLARVSPYAHLGEGVVIFANAVVNTGAHLGDGVVLNLAATVSHDTRVGSYCNINPGARLAGGGDVGEGCYIGMGTSVIQGISIGEWSVIGAGAVVVRDLPPNVTAVGVPARVIKTREKGWYER
jgi:sugar O-acyltransferase (sialic acid O-acetyltransferase NeuD family)